MGGLILAILLIWIGVTGRLGSLLGAWITPDFMVDGTENINGAGLTPGWLQAALSQTSSTVPVIIKGTQLSMDQIGQLAWNAGIKTASVLAVSIAIAMAESGGKSDIVNSIGATGLWQIYIKMHPEYTQKQMQDPVQNAGAMYKISSAGTNWNPWETFTNGAYKPFMSQATTAANAIVVGNSGAKQGA